MNFDEWWGLIDASGFARGKEGEAMKASAHDAWREAQRQERKECKQDCRQVETAHAGLVHPYYIVAAECIAAIDKRSETETN